ncbi:MAG: hypothetical protein AVDCRST_MAG47-1954, partial [uncultured Nocardioidaceae bacterium]
RPPRGRCPAVLRADDRVPVRALPRGLARNREEPSRTSDGKPRPQPTSLRRLRRTSVM